MSTVMRGPDVGCARGRAWHIVVVCLCGLHVPAVTRDGEARVAFQSDATVHVAVRSDDVLFEPAAALRRATGLLFFPGTPVDPVAYAPIARAIASRGYPTAIVFLPRRGLALPESDRLATRAEDAMRALGADRWVMAGHSRGGAFGGRLVLDQPDRYAALVLIGTTHPRSFNLARMGVDVIQVSGGPPRHNE